MIQVHPSAVVDKSAQLADGVIVGPNCVIGRDVCIGSDTVLDANVVIARNVKVGKNNHFFANCVIGAEPQVLGLSADDGVGGVQMGDNNVVHEQATIHPSAHQGGYTKIGDDNLIMVGVHVGHDCVLEDKLVMSNYVQLSGHCKIETGVWFSGVVLLHQFVTVGRWCYAAGFAGINHDVPPFMIVSGHYPPKVRGVNRRGLERAGLSEEQQQKICKAYEKLYRRGGPLLENAKALAQQDGLDENVRAVVDAVINSSKHRFGRYLEAFRG
jgi:UDP-N-acetylglucosamine acyltransferase